MDESLNPYASPLADLTPAAVTEGARHAMPGMKTTGIGLSLVYYGTIIVLLAVILSFLGGLFQGFDAPGRVGPPRAGFTGFIMVLGLAILGGSLLMFVGQIVCLAVPSETGAKGYIVATVVFQIIGIALAFLPIVRMFVPERRMLQPFTISANLVGILSTICFLLFMRKLSEFLGRGDLMGKAGNILIMLVAIVGIFVLTFFALLILGPAGVLLGIVFLILALICFVMYVNLINALRKVLLSNEPRSRKNLLLSDLGARAGSR